MRASSSYKTARSALASICLVMGHVRPLATSVPQWGYQPVSTSQPGADDAPVVATAASVAEQLVNAFSHVHPMEDLAARVEPDTRLAAEWQCSVLRAGGDVSGSRREFMRTLQACGEGLDGWSKGLGTIAPDWLQCWDEPFPHYALFECCIDAMELPDVRLPEDLCCGAPCVGDIPDSGNFCPNRDEPSIEVSDVDFRARQAEVMRSVAASGGDPDRHAENVELWARTETENRDGWVEPIGSYDDAVAFFGGHDFWPSVRFAVPQKGKLRPCENCRAALHNSATGLFERLVCDSADFPARVASLYAELLGSEFVFGMMTGTEDIAAAYRRMSCSEPWYTVFAQWDPTHVGPDGVLGRVVFFRLRGFNFGQRSAPNQFNRLSFCIARAAARLLRVVCTFYYDDFSVTEPTFAPGGQLLLRGLAALLRIPFAGATLGDGKSEAPGPRNAFLGVIHDFSRFREFRESTACVDPERITAACAVIRHIIETGSFDGTAGPSKLCGQLHFTISWGGRRFGRAAMQPLHSSAAHKSSAPISAELRAALRFICDLLVDPETHKPRLSPRRFRFKGARRGRARLPTVLVWSDARWEAALERPAGIGFVVFFPASEAEPWLPAKSRPAACPRPPTLGPVAAIVACSHCRHRLALSRTRSHRRGGDCGSSPSLQSSDEPLLGLAPSGLPCCRGYDLARRP